MSWRSEKQVSGEERTTPLEEAFQSWRGWVRNDGGFIAGLVGVVACGFAAIIWVASVTLGGEFTVSRIAFGIAIVALGAAVLLTIVKRIRLLSMFLEFALRRRRMCVTCGYNLRGVWSKRCPECGEAFG